MRGRSKEEIEEAIIVAIKNGNRSSRDIELSAKVGTHRINKYLQILIDKGKIVEAEPSIFDHGNVKKIYKLARARGGRIIGNMHGKTDRYLGM